MRIAILGGTGDIGEALALRWARDTTHELRIGSRKEAKALAAVEEYRSTLSALDADATIEGFDNVTATDGADVVVLAVPPYHVTDLVETVADSVADDAILVSPAVGIKRDDDGFHYHQPPAGSVTQLVADAAPDGVPVVGAFHNLAAGRLSALESSFEMDTLVVSDNADAKRTVVELAERIDGLRALDAGPLANAAEVEAVTPLLINVAVNNDGLHDLGVRFV